jgi:glycine hydroxymethyltransferase
MYSDGSFAAIKNFDPEMAALTEEEEMRQLQTLCLIASENYASPLALGLEGTILACKNAEGYPGRRFVAGCEIADKIERLAIERIKSLFGCEHVNIQAMSATIANIAVLRALLKPGDTILSMELNHGGHLSHGAKFHYSGKTYNTVFYGVSRDTEKIDMDEVSKQAEIHKPKLIICGTSSYPRTIDYKEFSQIAKNIGAFLLADIAHPVGLIAAGLIPSPVPYADVVTTSTHKTWRGSRGCGVVMCKTELGAKIDSQIFPGLQGAPKMDMIAARAVQVKESMTPEFRSYQQAVIENARILADEISTAGFRLVSGGTDTHLLLVDVRKFIPSGREAENCLEDVGIVVNKNMIPYDPQGPQVTSGIRIGSPALTTRGLSKDEFRLVANMVAEALKNHQNTQVMKSIKKDVSEIAHKFPLFAEKWFPKCLQREN